MACLEPSPGLECTLSQWTEGAGIAKKGICTGMETLLSSPKRCSRRRPSSRVPPPFLKQKWHKHHNTVHGDQVALEYSLTALLKVPKRGQTGLWVGVGALKIKRTPLAPRLPGGWEGSEIRGSGSSVHQFRMWKCSWGWEGAP